MITEQPPLSQFVNDRFVEQLLASSGPVNIIQAGEQLYKSLRQIRKSSEHENQKFVFFQQLTPAALYLIEGVAAIIEQQSAKKRQKTLQLCLQICRNLCLGLNSVYQAQDLSEEQKKQLFIWRYRWSGKTCCFVIVFRHRYQTVCDNYRPNGIFLPSSINF